MIDALNAIVEFLSSIWDTVLSFIHYSDFLAGFVSTGSGFLTSLFVLIPSPFLPFAVITVTLSVVLLVLGRTNSHG